MQNTLFLSLILFLTGSFTLKAQTRFNAFGEAKTSSAKCIYVNPKKKTSVKSFTFRTVAEALRYLDGKGNATIYIEPYVYWLNDPDSPAIVQPAPGSNTPFGMSLKMDNVHMIGLSPNPEDVVLASNRGQTQGANGNFTMLNIKGNGISAENITFGNYCNVDLVYARIPSLSRKKRGDAIVQAQLAICEGDDYNMKNCRFISRLNLCPFVGPKHVNFDNCYFECTDDALCGTGTYTKCRFTFYSSKPFYATSTQGAFFIDCDIHTKTHGTQYLTKVSSPVSLCNCRFTSEDPDLKIEWTKQPNPKHKCYMTDCTLNGKPLIVPTTPDVPMPVSQPQFGLMALATPTQGQWSLDAYCPSDVKEYMQEVDTKRPAWTYGEGMDGAEGVYGLIQNVKGARMMYTGLDSEKYTSQSLTLNLDPCKSGGQGFGSATGQYLDVCIKFDTRTLTGYGIRFIRTPKYDHAVDVMLVEYQNGNIRTMTEPEKCIIYKKGCVLTLQANADQFTATIRNGEQIQELKTAIAPTQLGGIHIQHTGSTGASATVISNIKCTYGE